jgi:type II secretory pathway component HofQ
MNLPILGNMFKRNQNQDDSLEVVIFLTPRVIERL